MAEATTSSHYSPGLAGIVGTIMSLSVYELIHGFSAFDLTRSGAVTDLSRHAAVGAALFAGGAAVRNSIA